MPKKSSPKNDGAFKNWINRDGVRRISLALSQADPDFDSQSFQKVSQRLAPLELKARVREVSQNLKTHLPSSYPQALKILLQSLSFQPLQGFELWPYSEFIQTHGLQYPQLSLKALHQLTSLFTSEFAVRPFLIHHTQETLEFLMEAAQSSNVHVRRWSSEGTRPRLPWGERLDFLIENPSLTLPLLERLKYDDELYVRKSVANHLNDIAKDHPKIVISTLKQWIKNSPPKHQEKISWITKQALRTLIKQGHPEALQLLGVSPKAKLKISSLQLSQKVLKVGDTLNFSFELKSQTTRSQKLIIDYLIHHQKSGGKSSAKVFKLKTVELSAQEPMKIQKNHSLRPVTTRKYYPGLHRLEIQINGQIVASQSWTLRK